MPFKKTGQGEQLGVIVPDELPDTTVATPVPTPAPPVRTAGSEGPTPSTPAPSGDVG